MFKNITLTLQSSILYSFNVGHIISVISTLLKIMLKLKIDLFHAGNKPQKAILPFKLGVYIKSVHFEKQVVSSFITGVHSGIDTKLLRDYMQ